MPSGYLQKHKEDNVLVMHRQPAVKSAVVITDFKISISGVPSTKQSARTQLKLIDQIEKNSTPKNVEQEEGNNNNNAIMAAGKRNDEHVREDIPRVIVSPASFEDSNCDQNPVTEQQLTTSGSSLSGSSRMQSDLSSSDGESSQGSNSVLSVPGSLHSDEGSLHSDMNSVLCYNDSSDSSRSCSTDSGCDQISPTGSLHSSDASH